MTDARAPRFLHVANGTCTTRIIEAAGIPGALSIWADPLYEGPVPGGVTDAALLELRARHLAGPAGETTPDRVNDLRRWRSTIADCESYDELILWFEHDLFDQLNLVQLLDWIQEHLPVARPVSLVCICTFPGHPAFKGLGELTPDELASLFGARQPVGDAQYRLAVRAWRAFREPSPEMLDRLRHEDTVALPHLAAAIGRLLQEFPWTTDGLSRTERRLLQLAEAGSVDLDVVFPRMHDDEEAYFITDTSLLELADNLSRTAPPLLTRVPGRRSGDGRRPGSATITGIGRAVLSGQQDRIAVCGIDRWLGGVHLAGGRDLFRWDEGRGTIVRVPAGA